MCLRPTLPSGGDSLVHMSVFTAPQYPVLILGAHVYSQGGTFQNSRQDFCARSSSQGSHMQRFSGNGNEGH